MPAIYLCPGKVPDVRAVTVADVSHAQVRGLSRIRESAPESPYGKILGDHAIFTGLIEGLHKKVAEHIVLLARCLFFPSPPTPIPIGRGILLHVFEEALFVYACAREHQRNTHHLILRSLVTGCTGTIGYVRIASGIDNPLRKYRLPPRFTLGDNPLDDIAFHHRFDSQAMQERHDTRFLYQFIRHVLEHVRVKLFAIRLGVLLGPAHRLCPFLELDTDPFHVGRPLMPVPSEAFHSHLRDVAAEAPIALHQHRCHAFTGSAQRRCKTARTAPDNQNIRFRHDGHHSRHLFYLLH